eukprot:13941047-Alexandrium_andersonii.AAC.1
MLACLRVLPDWDREWWTAISKAVLELRGGCTAESMRELERGSLSLRPAPLCMKQVPKWRSRETRGVGQ